MYANGCISYRPIPLVLVRDRGFGPRVLPPPVLSTPLLFPPPLFLSLFLYVWLFLIPQCDSWIPQVCPYTRVYRGERITSYRCAARGEQNASIARKRELTRFPGEPVPQFRRQRALSARVTLAPAAISPLILRRRSYWQTVASDRN